ncbi:MAG: DUF1080 domain-containing protein [Bacteroidota bacterium]
MKNLQNTINWGFFLSFLLFISCSPLTKETDTSASGEMQKEATKSYALFDGKSFEGWEGPDEFFRIEDATIIAGSLEREIPTNLFMCTEKKFEDFDLSLKVKFQPYKNNGGIQIRSERIPDDHEVIGYQVDVGYAGEKPVWASIYDESRRNKFIAEADADRIAALLKKDDFNDYRILCEGPHLKVWFNGEQVIDYVEEEEGIARKGKICVQIHGGSPAEASYKDIVIEEL